MRTLAVILCTAAALAAPLCLAQDAESPADTNTPSPAPKVAEDVRKAVLDNVRQQVACLRDLRDTICMVQDKAGAEAAAPKVKEIAERYVQLAEASQKFGEVMDDTLLQEALQMLQDEPAAESLPLIITMLADNDYYGSTALKEALAPMVGDSTPQATEG